MTDLQELSMEELVCLHRLNKDLIASLESEIELCQQQIGLFGPGADLSKEMKMIERSNNGDEAVQRLHNSLANYERRLEESVKLTGISITDLTETTEVTDDNSTCQSRSLKLDVLGHKVMLKCEIENNLDQPKAGVVTWFELQIIKDMNDVIGEPLARLTTDLQMHRAINLIKSYTHCVNERSRLIQQFIQIYPDDVTHWKQSQTTQGLKVVTQGKRPSFSFEWNTEVDEDTVVNKLSLKVEVSRELKALDTKGVFNQASENFEITVSLLGPEQAIDAFIKMILTDGKDILSLHHLQSIQHD